MKPADASIQAVLFDFDGTLVDSEYLHHQSWLSAVEPWGVTLGWDDYQEQLVGKSDRYASEFFLRLAALEPTGARVALGRERKQRAYRLRAVEELTIVPAVREWIRKASRRVPLGVVSSSAAPDVVPILERQGVAACMSCTVCGNDVKVLKPDPAPYLLAYAKLQDRIGVEAPSRCLVFEDSDTGVRSARAAGMTVCKLESPDVLPLALRAWEKSISLLAGRTRSVA